MPLSATARYDATTILLHWLTAALVIFQFASAELWDFFPRPERHFLIDSHMSLGVLLTLILAVRIFWRLSAGARLPAASASLLDRGAKALHHLLYALLVIQMPLGFFTRWTDNHPLFIDQLHVINAWVIMGLAGVHAAAALIHHYGLHDQILARMLPRPRRT
jgi:cytochrome b561